MTTLPIEPELFWGVLILGALLLACLVVMALLPTGDPITETPLEKLKHRLGLSQLNSGVFLIAALLWIVIFLMLFAGLLAMIWDVIWSVQATEAADVWDWRFTLTKLTALTAVLGAVVALPFTVIRMGQTDEQNRHNELVLLNDRIQSALALLSARATETKIARTVKYTLNEVEHSEIDWQEDRLELPEGAADATYQDWQVYELGAPDIQTRLSGIGQLEAILQEEEAKGNESLRRRINEYLANFIRANPRADALEGFKPPEPDWPTADFDEKDAYRTAWQDAARALKLRPDVQAAITLIGRSTKEAQTRDLDLRGVNLQGADLPEAFLERIRFQGARLQGADLDGARLQGATLGWARLQGADLDGARLQGADLGGARLQGADLDGARLQGADLGGARLQGATLGGARLQGATLGWARLQGADLGGARLQGATLGGARLQGADLGGARLQGADLDGARFDELTALTAATFRGAAVKAVDFTTIPQITEFLEEIFGDGSTTPPEGAARPRHWPEEELDWDEFREKWRGWQASLGPDPDAGGD